MSQGRPSERVDVISTSDPESASIPVEFQTSVQEKGTSTSAQLHCVNSYQDKCGKDMQGSDEDNEPEGEESDSETLLGGHSKDRKSLDHQKKPNSNHSYRGKSKLSAMKTSGIIIGFIIGAILLLTSIGLGVYVGLNAHNSQCASASASSSIEKLIAKNSTVILLNTTDDYAAGQQACYEPNITITAKFPMNIYLLPCQSVRYFNYTYVRNSLEYPNQSNPLPSGFDENYHNYLVKGHISVTVNVSLTEINPAMPAEYIYFCLYMDYTQFQNFISKSTTSYWKNYDGNQCNRQQLGDDENAMILKDTLNFTQPEYVFVGFGSTVDILGTFKFTVNVSGQKLLDPGQTPSEDSITESCILGDQQHTCQLALNLENISEALCIIGSRPVDHISQEPFKRLTVKWAPKFNKPDKTIKIAISVVAALAGISGIVLLSLCSYFCYKKCTSKLDCSSKPIQEQNTDSS